MAGMHEEEVENLNSDLRENETQNGGLLQQYQHEISLKTQQIDNLQKSNEELKENLHMMQSQHNNTFESQINSFKEERQQLMNKIDQLAREISLKDKAMFASQQRIETLEYKMNKKAT